MLYLDNDRKPGQNPELIGYDYTFLKKLAVDNPTLALEVIAKLPAWKAWLEAQTGSSTCGEKILELLDYVSQQEIENSISQWATQVEEQLRKQPNKRAVFILDRGGGSQKYYGLQVYDQLPKELQSRVVLLEGNEVLDWMANAPLDFDSFLELDFWRFDDSANSGSQVTQMNYRLFSFVDSKLKNAAQSAGKIEEYEQLLMAENEFRRPTLNLRFIRITEYAKHEIKTKWAGRRAAIHGDDPAVVVSLHLEANGIFPQMDQVASAIGSNEMSPEVRNQFISRHVNGFPTLGIFANKLQDNLPGIVSRSATTPKNLSPLFESNSIVPPWNTSK